MALCALLCGTMLAITPWQLDDIAYGIPWKAAMEGAGPGPGLGETADFMAYHWHYVNGRLGDKLMPVALGIVPKWLFGLLGAAACFVLLRETALTAFGSVQRHPLRSSALACAMMLLLPWGSYMFLTNMFLNYGFGAALAAAAVRLFFRGSGARASMPRMAGAAALGFLAGAWHESFAAGMLPGMTLLLLLSPRWRRRLPLAVWTGIAAGLAFILCSPGFWNRCSHFTVYAGTDPYIVPGMLKGANVTLLLPAVYGLMLCVRRVRRRMSDVELWYPAVCLGAMAITACIYLNTLRTPRVWWYTDIFALTALAMLAAPLCSCAARWLKIAAVAAGAAASSASYGIAIYVQTELNREFREITELYAASADGTVYYDWHGNCQGPPVTLRKGRIFAFFPDARDNYMPDYYRRDGATLKLLPTCLRDFDLDKATRLEGTQTYNYKGCMLTVDTAVIATRKLHPLCVRADGSALYPPVLVSPVRDRHGRLCGYMEPDGRWAPPGQVAAICPATE